MYEIDDKDHIVCLTCGDKIVTVKSHKPFCKGFAGKPWTALALTKDRFDYWKNDPGFIEWARKNRVRLPGIRKE
jgi:hypothetical protein